MRYASVVLDVDSTLAGIEGIDWLARRAGADVAARVGALTQQAMAGEIPLESVYGRRLAMIRPRADDIARLADAYRAALAPGAERVVRQLISHDVHVALVSGGIRQAILPLAHQLGVVHRMVRAVDLSFDEQGAYAGFDESSPLATHEGKAIVVRALDLAAPLLAVGDGATDIAMKDAAAAFAAFTGFAHRAPVVAAADFTLSTFDELLATVLA